MFKTNMRIQSLCLPHLLHKTSYTNSYYNHSSVKHIFPSVNTEQQNNVNLNSIMFYVI